MGMSADEAAERVYILVAERRCNSRSALGITKHDCLGAAGALGVEWELNS